MTPEEEWRWKLCERHGELLIDRLSRLTAKGYKVAETGYGVVDFVHTNPKATPVQLWPDGQVVDRYPTDVKDGERTIIDPTDEERFDLFIAHVPPPTRKLMDLTLGAALLWLSGLATFALIVWIVSKVVEWLTG